MDFPRCVDWKLCINEHIGKFLFCTIQIYSLLLLLLQMIHHQLTWHRFTECTGLGHRGSVQTSSVGSCGSSTAQFDGHSPSLCNI